ncbi:MAG: energy-coupling factor transporter transmembrane component T family protein [Solirubrobacteraceae bacterium]
MIYKRRASPLHAAGAGAAIAWYLALACAALMLSNPLVLGALTVAVLLAGALAGVWRELRGAALIAVSLALTIALVNALLTRDGLTVIARLGNLPVLGVTDVTLEATVSGAILGLRAAALILCGALYSLTVDPDEVLALFRRFSFRSALTATIATRMVPVLLRDSRRLADAQRCRPGRAPGRLALMRATTAGVLDRALDIAAALEVRGYATPDAPRGHRSVRRPRSRHDIAFGLSAVAIVVLVIVARAGDLVPFRAYPTLYSPVGGSVLACACALPLLTLAPFADHRGIE